MDIFGYSVAIDGGTILVGSPWQESTTANDVGSMYVFSSQVIVSIDVKPGSDTNPINLKAKKGVIPVAILTTDHFDATTVDHTTVVFAGASESHVHKKTGEVVRHKTDVDGGGDIDLLLHFRVGDTELNGDSTEAVLTGKTFAGQDIVGSDAVRIVGNEGHHRPPHWKWPGCDSPRQRIASAEVASALLSDRADVLHGLFRHEEEHIGRMLPSEKSSVDLHKSVERQGSELSTEWIAKPVSKGQLKSEVKGR